MCTYLVTSASESRTRLIMAQHIQHVTTMSHANPASHEGVADNHEAPHETPGAYLFPFGPFAGKRLDAVPTSLRWWATQPKCKDNNWVSTVYDSMNITEIYKCSMLPAWQPTNDMKNSSLKPLRRIPSHGERVKVNDSMRYERISFGGPYILRIPVNTG